MAVLELVSPKGSLGSAIDEVFERLSRSGEPDVGLMFDISWGPTMDVVELIVRAVQRRKTIKTLTLVHPSAAMSVIAGVIASRTGLVVTSKRSMYDEEDDEETDATASKTVFRMDANEALDGFVRRSIREAESLAVRRFALFFDPDTALPMGLADMLVEELVQSGVREVGLVHPETRQLDAIAASIRLRLPRVHVSRSSGRVL